MDIISDLFLVVMNLIIIYLLYQGININVMAGNYNLATVHRILLGLDMLILTVLIYIDIVKICKEPFQKRRHGEDA